MAHDAPLLALLVIADLAILACWQFLASRLVPGSGPVVATPAPEAEPALHRALTWVCSFLLVGLMIEATGTIIVILLRYGFSR